MRSIALLLATTFLLATPSISDAAKRTKGYVTKSGTYVAPHYSSSPNRTKADNWSSKGNVNPYTGKKGYKDPYAPKKRKSDR